jgi:hypothetical protein
MPNKTTYRLAAALALATTFLLVVVALGVGVLGPDGHPANLLYAGVVGAGLSGAYVARLRADGMARTLIAMAWVQIGIGAFALVAETQGAPLGPPLETLGLTAMFVTLFAGSAFLFRQAARPQPPAGAARRPQDEAFPLPNR